MEVLIDNINLLIIIVSKRGFNVTGSTEVATDCAQIAESKRSVLPLQSETISHNLCTICYNLVIATWRTVQAPETEDAYNRISFKESSTEFYEASA